MTRIARQLDIGPGSLRRWVVWAEIDRVRRAGTTSEEAQRIGELERENREWNTMRLHSACEDVPPAEYGAACWASPQVASAA